MNNQRGYALVISVLVLGTMLLSIAAATAFSLSRTQLREQGWESGMRAQSLAEGCAEYAILQLRLDGTYAGNEEIEIQGEPCTVRPILLGASTTIETEATVDNRVYRLRVEVEPTDIVIESWKRVITF